MEDKAANRLLRDARVRLFGTQHALAEAANQHLPAAYLMTANDIGKLERGIVGKPSPPRCAALRLALGVTTDAEIGLGRRRELPQQRQPGTGTPGMRPLFESHPERLVLPPDALEEARHRLESVVAPDRDSWQEVLEQYGRRYYTAPATELMDSLRVDLEVIRRLLASSHESEKPKLYGAGSRLSLLMAMALAADGETAMVERWRSSARLAATRSGDRQATMLVGSWEIIEGLFERRHLTDLLDQADRYLAIAGKGADPAVAGLHAGRAQVLAVMGRHGEAATALQTLSSLKERMPEEARGSDSLFAWPDYRYYYTESFVYSRSGDRKRSAAAREAVLALCPPEFARMRSHVELHHSLELVLSGDVECGLHDAARILDELPQSQHTAILHEVARHVLDAAPAESWETDAYVCLRYRLVHDGQ